MAAIRAERATVGRTPTVATWGERWLGLVAHRVRPATLAVYQNATRTLALGSGPVVR